MKKLRFSTVIDADRQTVWNTMLAPDTFRDWTAEFAEGSYFEGSWDKGARIRFLTPDGSGMSSMIEDNRPYEFLSIRHLGEIKNGVEDTGSDAVRSWAPAFENYSLRPAGSGTDLKVDMDVTPPFEEYFARVWPKALARLKAICERKR